MMNQNRTELKRAAAGLAVLLLAAAVLTGAAAADDTSNPPLKGGAFYYENLQGFDKDVYKYLDNIIALDGTNVLDAVSSYPEGTYSSTTTTNAFILKKLDAEVLVYIWDGPETNPNSKIISSFSTRDGGVIPRGSYVSFRISPNIPTAYSKNPNKVGLKFISPNGTVASTYLGGTNYANDQPDSWKENSLETKPMQLDTTLEEGEWTVFAYFVPDSANGYFALYTPESYLNATAGHFTITPSSVTMTVNPKTVSVGKDFTVTVSGKAGDICYLKKNSKYSLNPGQDKIEDDGEKPDYYKVTIGQTGSTAFTLKAIERGVLTLQLCSSTNPVVIEDDCEIEIVRATLTAEADKDSYYMGTDVTLRGTNESAIYPLYYYIEGANISFREIKNTDSDTYLKPTMTGKEWETTIKGSYFSNLKLDTAAYTIYVSDKDSQNKTEVTGPNAVVSTATVRLIKPQITITSSPSVVIQDENLVVKGVAETASQVRYYIFGNNKHCSDTVDVGRNGNFVIDKTLAKTEFDTGQYFMVIQHPMYDGNFNVAAGLDTNNEPVVALNTTGDAAYKDTDGTWKIYTESQILFSLNERQSANAAQALCDAIDSENIDDIYAKCSFELKADATTVDPIPSEVTRGMPFTVSGTAARVDGTSISVELLSTTFSPESKYSATSASFVTMITYPGADGKWAVTFDTSGLNIDTYNISVSANAVKVHQAVIRVAEGTAAPAAQEIPAAPTAAAATPTPTPAPTKNASTPGFGAAVILAGFGAAALALSGRRL